jgi:hypothetical protein
VSILFFRTLLKEVIFIDSVMLDPFDKASLRHSILFCRSSLKELVCVNSVLQDPFERASLSQFCSAGPV